MSIPLPVTTTEMIFSGSATADPGNRAGFGADALVAMFTSFYLDGNKSPLGGTQAQSLAFTTDPTGITGWKHYANNPVLDIGSDNFRDPKVATVRVAARGFDLNF
jgi:fructan beta-fructosidase